MARRSPRRRPPFVRPSTRGNVPRSSRASARRSGLWSRLGHLLGLLVILLCLANERLILQFANCLVGSAHDLLAVLEAREHLEVLLAGDANADRSECYAVIGADDEHPLHVLLPNVLRRRRAAERH